MYENMKDAIKVIKINHCLEALLIEYPNKEKNESEIRTDFENIVGKHWDLLTERERKIIELRFGIGTGDTHTLEEVGKVFKLTRERIREIEAKALMKLRFGILDKINNLAYASNF